MDKYHCSFDISTKPDFSSWTLTDHKGKIVAMGTVYSNYHNAKRALERHIAVIQSGNFTLPPKPERKPYTRKSHENIQTSTTNRPHRKGNEDHLG